MVKKSRFVLFVAVILFLSTQNLFALDSSNIERLRKSVGTGKLSPSDRTVLNEFVSEAVTEMLLTEDISQISQIRYSISQQKGNSSSQYAMEFVLAAKKTIGASLKKAATLQEGPRRLALELNLLILAAEMKSIKMTDFGLDMIDSQNAAIHYWAIKTIASPHIAKQLTARATANPQLKEKIIDALTKEVEQDINPAGLSVILNFTKALGTDDSEGSELIYQIAQQRIEQYQNWTVKYELLDRDLLNILTACTFKAGIADKRSQCARTFGQLFSYVMQRYLLGYDTLSANSKQQLVSVMVDVEKSSFGAGKFLARPQTAIKDALMQKKMNNLQREYDILFGSSKRIGRIASSLKFDYGTNAAGNPIISPKRLKAPKTNK